MTATTPTFGDDALIACDNLVRIYQVENIEVQALQGLDLLVDQGEMIAIVGQSGSGKSTLLNVLSGLDVPTAGAARVGEWDLLRMSQADRLTYRRSVVGFVWQQTARNLLPYLSSKENVMLPMAFSGKGARARSRRALELLDAMGMAGKAHRRPHQLSGGEQQRVSIAVALANAPHVLFADEPTGELDSATGEDVFEALRSANKDLGATVVVVTHDQAVSSQVQRTIAIRDGRTSTEVVRRTEVAADGTLQTHHEEYAVLDRAGRLQLPRDYREALDLRDRVRLELEEDHVGIWNDATPRRERPAPPEPAIEASPEPAPGPASEPAAAAPADAPVAARRVPATEAADAYAPPPDSRDVPPEQMELPERAHPFEAPRHHQAPDATAGGLPASPQRLSPYAPAPAPSLAQPTEPRQAPSAADARTAYAPPSDTTPEFRTFAPPPQEPAEPVTPASPPAEPAEPTAPASAPATHATPVMETPSKPSMPARREPRATDGADAPPRPFAPAQAPTPWAPQPPQTPQAPQPSPPARPAVERDEGALTESVDTATTDAEAPPPSAPRMPWLPQGGNDD